MLTKGLISFYKEPESIVCHLSTQPYACTENLDEMSSMCYTVTTTVVK